MKIRLNIFTELDLLSMKVIKDDDRGYICYVKYQTLQNMVWFNDATLSRPRAISVCQKQTMGVTQGPHHFAIMYYMTYYCSCQMLCQINVPILNVCLVSLIELE